MNTSNFRLATEADLPAIRDILNQAIVRGGLNAFTEVVDLDNRRHWLAQHPADRFPVYVLEAEGQVIGWLSFSGYRAARKALSGVTEIAYYLHDDWQGKGYGRMMLHYLMDTGKALGFTHLLAILMDTNLASARLLEKENFARWAHLPDIAVIPQGRAGQFYYGLDLRK